MSRYPCEFSGLYNLHPWHWNALLQSHLLWGEFSAFSASVTNHYNFSLFCSTKYPSLLGGKGNME